jgi:hypothetical protein
MRGNVIAIASFARVGLGASFRVRVFVERMIGHAEPIVRASRTAFAALAFVVCAFGAAPVHAQTLSLSAPSDRGCPDDGAFRQALVERLSPPSLGRLQALRIDVRIAPSSEDDVLIGSIDIEGGAAGAPSGYARAFQSRSCAALANALALAVTLFMEQSGSREDTPPAKPPAEAPRSPVEWTTGFGAAVSYGDGPEVVGGAFVFGDARVSALRLTLEAHASAPSGITTSQGRIQVRALGALAASCFGPTWFFGCVAGELDDRIVSAVGVPGGRTDAAPLVAAGLRAGAAIPLGAFLSLRITLDGLYALKPDRVALRGQEVYSFAPGILRAGAGLGARF